MGRNEHFDAGHNNERIANERIKRAAAKEKGEALAEGLLNSLAQSSGFHDAEHMFLTERNKTEEAFAQKYKEGPGKLTIDPDISDGFHYRVSHPSGYYGIHRGANMDIYHPKHGAVDLISYVDYQKHGILSPMKPEEWPSPQQVHQDLHEWVAENGDDYNEHYS